MRTRVEQIEHTADLALRVFASSTQGLFAAAARAMFGQLSDLASTPSAVQRHVTVEAPDQESLLVEWLNELLYLHEIHGEVYTTFAFDELSRHRLRATVSGGKPAEILTIIKSATYHDLSIRERQDGVVATIVFDV